MNVFTALKGTHLYIFIRKIGHSNVSYIDDCLLKSQTEEDCMDNIRDTVQLVESLGFTVHPVQYIIPTQEIVFVVFVFNCKSMTIRLTHEKADDIFKMSHLLLKLDFIVIRDLAKFIGKLVASEPGVQYALLYYKTVEIEKKQALRLTWKL